MKRKIYPYNPQLKLLARELRSNSTAAEIILWKELKGKTFNGYDFHRQKPILNYIVDFFCHELELAIEIDGYSHYNEEQFLKDELRQKDIEKLGIAFLRFDDAEIKNDMPNVLRTIEIYIEAYEKNLSE